MVQTLGSAVLTLAAVSGTAILVVSSIMIARIAIPNVVIRIGAIALAGGLAILTFPFVWGRAVGSLGDVGAVGVTALSSSLVFAIVLAHLVATGITRLWSYSSRRPPSLRGSRPGCFVLFLLAVTFVIAAAVGWLFDAPRWGLAIGLLVAIDGYIHAHSWPLYKAYFSQRLADLDVDAEEMRRVESGRASGPVVRKLRKIFAPADSER